MTDDAHTDKVPTDHRVAGVRTTKHRGRMTAARRTLIGELSPQWAVGAGGDWGDRKISDAFGRQGPVAIDIGVGDGEASRHLAAQSPELNVVAVEVHQPGIATLLATLDRHGPPNVRVAIADACGVLAELSPGTITMIRVLFPDPWPKRRHHHRRLVDAEFAQRATALLVPGGCLHVATDQDDYAQHVRSVMAAAPALLPQPTSAGDLNTTGAPGGGWCSARPERPVTPYEERGIHAGRSITDLVWLRDLP